MYFCANLTPSLFYDEGYLFWKMNVDKFENMGDKLKKLGDKFTMLGDKLKKLGDKLKKLAGSSQC